jgi:hypothetical protein
MCRRSELLFFYQNGASHIFPDKFQPYRDHIPEAERGDLIQAYYKRLTSEDGDTRQRLVPCIGNIEKAMWSWAVRAVFCSNFAKVFYF